MCHLIDNVILIMSYILALELNIILVSYLTTNVAKIKNWMGALKQGRRKLAKLTYEYLL